MERSKKKLIQWLLLIAVISAATFSGLYYWQLERNIQRSPFSAIRWRSSVPEVRLNNQWYILKTINNIPAETLIRFAQKTYSLRWQLMIEDSLTEVISSISAYPGRSIDLQLLGIPDRSIQSLSAVPMTVTNLDSIRFYRLTQSSIAGTVTDDFSRPPINAAQPDSFLQNDSLFYKNLVRRIDGFRPPANWQPSALQRSARAIQERISNPPQWLSAREASADIDQIEWYLSNKFAYLDVLSPPYQPALDSIRQHLSRGISRRDFACQLQKVMVLFADRHSGIDFPENQIDFPSQQSPFRLFASEKRILPLLLENDEFFKAEYPFLSHVNNHPMRSWLKTSERYCVSVENLPVSPQQMVWLHHFGFLSREMNSRLPGVFNISLESADAAKSFIARQTSLPETKIPTAYQYGKHSIEIPDSLSVLAPESLIKNGEKITGYMANIRSQKGLVLDLRGNAVKESSWFFPLLPYLLPPDDYGKVLEVATLRLNAEENPKTPAGYLANQQLHPRQAPLWGTTEAQYLQSFEENFKPDFSIDQNRFSDWHYLSVVKKNQTANLYHFSRQVVILTDAYSPVSAERLCSILQGKDNITILGTPSGISGRHTKKFHLNYSGLAIKLSETAYFRPDGYSYRLQGIQPDILHHPAPADIVGTSDTMLASALVLLSRQHLLQITRR